jgi:hypothetical protein
MARPKVENGGDGLQIWRVAVNIESAVPDGRGVFLQLEGWALGLKRLAMKTRVVMKCHKGVQINLRETGWGGMDWTALSQDRNH